MPLFFLKVKRMQSLEPGPVLIFIKRLHRSESDRRRLRRNASCGYPGMAIQVRPACHRRYWCFSIILQVHLAAVHLSNLCFMIGMPNRCCILELRANYCSVWNFLSVPIGSKAKLRRRKPIVLVALDEISENC